MSVSRGNIPFNNERILVSFLLFTYNQEKFIREAVESALSQDYSPLEIIISDDYSTDRTYQIIEEVVDDYSGDHSVVISQNSCNLGLGAHVNKIWEMASGELVILQAGDDISLPHRTSRIVDTWRAASPTPDLIFSAVSLIDENGNKIDERTNVIVPESALKNTIIGKFEYVTGGCCSAYAKAVHWTVGPLREDTIAEDYVYTFRAMLGNGIVGIEEKLVHYRQHAASIMGKSRSRADNKRRTLIGRYSRLLEYKKAMNAYGFNDPYMIWRLNRRIKTFELAVRSFEVGILGKAVLAFYFLVTFRFELTSGVLRYAFDKVGVTSRFVNRGTQ